MWITYVSLKELCAQYGDNKHFNMHYLIHSRHI